MQFASLMGTAHREGGDRKVELHIATIPATGGSVSRHVAELVVEPRITGRRGLSPTNRIDRLTISSIESKSRAAARDGTFDREFAIVISVMVPPAQQHQVG